VVVWGGVGVGGGWTGIGDSAAPMRPHALLGCGVGGWALVYWFK
jgi:hypothetical protein